ncbi:Hypothetical protein PHPALM_20 [Phytophthora palmivora]|uniref:Transmembrane protein n=1 Tax=Phytophthora palmivora TaxID=4796 RepID=A0A2P4YVW5_9STRA|nr:Hypothetical protein PHPALM_20 [Phytophthora palmivora]
MTAAIRTATQNAQVLVAFHAMTSIALDFYVDTVTRLRTQIKTNKHVSRDSKYRQKRVGDITKLGNAEQTIFLEWLLLLEQLAGLLCSGLHELDAVYYMEIAHQFRSLILDLQTFLRKMERFGTHSRQQALMLFLDNLHRLLKRATNRNELRVVAADGSGIVNQTKSIRQRLRSLDASISTSLGVLLGSEEGMKNFSRMLVSMQFAWRRVMGPTLLETSMSTSTESISLLKKISEKITQFLQVLHRPTAWFKYYRKNPARPFDSPSRQQNTQSMTDSLSAGQSSQRNSEKDGIEVADTNLNMLRSTFPFISLELLLDNFGMESLAVKRIKQLVDASKEKNAVLGVLKSGLGIGEEVVEKLSVLELVEHFSEFENPRKVSDLFDQLEQLTLDEEMPFSHLPFVVYDKMEVSLWRLMVRPVQRLRLFHLYHQTQRFVLNGVITRIRHWIISLGAYLILLIAFWRQEELRTDLNDPVMACAFDIFPGTDDLTAAMATKKNTFMKWVIYSYGMGVFLLAVTSIVLIARNRFVLLEQTRLRLRPVSRYYQNVLAVIAIGVELVQLNSLAFDSAVEWDTTDKVPVFIQWLGNQGITQFGISSVSGLEALGILCLLLSWVFLLKCANKFRETSALLHRVLTKDLPALVHGFLYMSTISVFFSFLACVDCSDKHSSSYSKCKLTPESPPFLIAHRNIPCWTSAHQWYALLGLWGITFFLPIGLLAHGMSQVLFQRETLDIKYAPVLLLVAQLVKAAAATAKAFFPHDPMVLASLGVFGNAVLLVLTFGMHSCSLWYIKYIKCSIYAASCWASLGAIHRRRYPDQSSTRSLNMIYFGWLSIGLVLASAILLKVWHRAGQKQRDAERHFAAQQRLLNAGKATGALGAVEQKFVKAARKYSNDTLIRAAFISNAKKLTRSTPPALNNFIARATEPPANMNEAARTVVFMQSARVMAKKLREHEELRRRR